jgi:hypothetical protein
MKLFFQEGGLATGREKRISPFPGAPVEMASFAGLKAW